MGGGSHGRLMRVQAVDFFAGSLPMVVEEGSIVEISPAVFRLSPDAAPEAVGGVVGRAKVVQFDSPLPHRLLDALAQALSEHPETELYIYGHYGLDIDSHLRFLNGFEQIRALSLNLQGLKALDGLARFDCLRQLTLQGMPSIPSLEPLEDLGGLEDLVLPGAVHDVAALSSLTSRQPSLWGRYATSPRLTSCKA